MGMGTSELEGVAAVAYDAIVHELYSAGLAMYGVAARLGPGPTGDRLLQASVHLDDAIKRLGVLVLAFGDPAATSTGRFAARLFDTLQTATPELDAAPATRLAGPVGDLSEELVDDLLAVTRRSVTALAGYAHPRPVEVDITAADGGVCLRVSVHRVDPDGHLGDLETGGTVRGAHLMTERDPSGDTRLTWTVAG